MTNLPHLSIRAVIFIYLYIRTVFLRCPLLIHHVSMINRTSHDVLTIRQHIFIFIR